MLKIFLERSKVIAKQLVIAFFFTTFIVFLMMIIFGNRINKYVNTINKMAVGSFNYIDKTEDIKMNKVKKRLTKYPSFGDKFGSIQIDSIGVDIPLYHGETLDILKYGAGHHAGSYFPGEGGTVIIAAHNTRKFFYNLPKVNISDIVTIKASYGTYRYRIYKTEIINAHTLGKDLKISDNEESLMLYTCYPVNYLGYTKDRFVAYATLVGEDDE